MTSTPQHPGWIVQLNVHRSVRRDVGRLAAALAEGGSHDPAAVRAYWAETSFQLHHHHELEDTVIWPLMAQRLGAGVEALLARNAGEHRAMVAAMDAFDSEVIGLHSDAANARRALSRLSEAIDGHLRHEEDDVLPLIPEAFTLEDIAVFQAESVKTNPPHAFLPWVLDDAPAADAAFFTERLPAAVLEQLESAWLARRRTIVEALSATGRAAVAMPSAVL